MKAITTYSVWLFDKVLRIWAPLSAPCRYSRSKLGILKSLTNHYIKKTSMKISNSHFTGNKLTDGLSSLESPKSVSEYMLLIYARVPRLILLYLNLVKRYIQSDTPSNFTLPFTTHLAFIRGREAQECHSKSSPKILAL